MSDELRGVVVCHGRLAGALVDAAEQISGVTGALDRGVQHRLRPGHARGAGRARRSAPGPAVVFVDLASGSCLFAVLNRLRAHAVGEGRDRRQPGHAGGLRLSPRARRSDEAAARGGHRRRQGDPGSLMPIVLCRVDDRLIHGQVVIGWGRPARRRAHRAGGRRAWPPAPGSRISTAWRSRPRSTIRFATVAEAAAQLAGWQASERRGLLLTGDLETMAALHRADPAVVHRINLGGDPPPARAGASGCRISI